MLRNDNLEWGLYANWVNVWQLAWTHKEAYGKAREYWERVMCKGKWKWWGVLT